MSVLEIYFKYFLFIAQIKAVVVGEGGRFQETSEVEMTRLRTSQREKSPMNLLLLPTNYSSFQKGLCGKRGDLTIT